MLSCSVGSGLDIRSSGRGVGAIYYYDEEDHGYSDSDDDVDNDDDVDSDDIYIMMKCVSVCL